MTTEFLPAALQAPAAPAAAALRPSWVERRFHWCAAGLLVAMAAAQFASATLESQTVDESYHLTAGYAFLTSRTLNTGTEHPPLAQAICALPLLFLHLPAPGPADVDYRSELKREAKLLYGNSVSADAILLAARSSQIVLTLFLGLLIAWWTRRHFGSAPALAALALFAFDPNFLAHGHYVTNDVPAALAFLAGCLSWNAYLAGGRRSRLVFCGVVLGLAVSAKYSTLLLFPAFAYLYGCRWWHQSHAAGLQPFRYSLRHLTRSMLAAALVMMVVVWAAFGFETAPLLPPGPLSGPGPAIWAGFQGPLGWAVRNLPLPAPSFLNGVLALFWHNNSAGHSAYLLGQHSQSGWWYYFPVLAAVKTPAGTLLLFLLAAGAAGMLLWRGGSLAARARLKRLRPEWYAIAVPALLYLAACLRGHINIGIRHLLPFYPFLFIWIAAVLFSSRRRSLPAFFRHASLVCLALVAVESAAAFPRYLAFFNLPSGGRSHGWKYAVDSNLDWGQDLKRLKTYVSTHGIDKVCFRGMGNIPAAYYGIPAVPLPSSLEAARASGCVVAASITLVIEWRAFAPSCRWLADLHPTDVVGDSYWIYDFRRPQP